MNSLVHASRFLAEEVGGRVLGGVTMCFCGCDNSQSCHYSLTIWFNLMVIGNDFILPSLIVDFWRGEVVMSWWWNLISPTYYIAVYVEETGSCSSG